MICHTHYYHNRQPMWHPHKQHHQIIEWCYTSLRPIYICIQQIHLKTIKYLTLFMPNKQSLEITPTASTHHLKAHTKTATYKYQNLKNEPYNMMAKSNYIVEMKEYKTTWSHPRDLNPSHVATKNTPFRHNTHPRSTQHCYSKTHIPPNSWFSFTIRTTCDRRQ